jgi:hypothetical protein
MKNTNKGSGGVEGIIFLVILILTFLFGFNVGEQSAIKDFRLMAVEMSAAHWEVNPVNGASSFHWNNEVKKP